MTNKLTNKLDALRIKMEGLAQSGNAGFWTPKQGDSIIRILPPVGTMEFFFQEVAKYVFGDKYFYSPDFTTDGALPCPVRDLVTVLYKGSDADRELATKLNSWPIYAKKYWMNIIVRAQDDDGGTTGEGPFIFTPGITIFSALITLVNSSDYGDISNPKTGIDIVINRKGEKVATKYQINPRRYDGPLHTNKDTLEEWLNAATDLSWVQLSDDPAEDESLSEDAIIKLLPYDRIIKEFGLEPNTADVESAVAQLEKKSASPMANKTKESPQKVMKAQLSKAAIVTPVVSADDEVGEVLKASRERRRRRRK